jgi:hypothetical protein
LFRSEILFRTTGELEYFFFQNLTLGYMTKTLNQIIFFPPPKSEYSEQETITPPLQVKWSVPNHLVISLLIGSCLIAKRAICQLYYGENKLRSMRVELCLCSTRSTRFHSTISLKQHFGDRHFVPLEHIILIPRQPVFALAF